MLSTEEKLQKLRMHMKEFHVDAYLVQTGDAHGSEYPPESEARRAYLTGFTGSAGTAVVTQEEALLWTDGRYYIQAEDQLDSKFWRMMKDSEKPSIVEWLKKNEKISTVAFDPHLTSIRFYRHMHKSLTEESQPPKHLSAISKNLVDLLWDSDGRPAKPKTNVEVLSLDFAGVPVSQKVANIREKLKAEGVDATVLSRLDDVAWVLNMRASDIQYCPLFLSYLYISHEAINLYVEDSRLSLEAKKHLKESAVSTRSYEEVFGDLHSLYGKSLPCEVDYSVQTKANCVHPISKSTNPKSDFVVCRRLWVDEEANLQLYKSVENPTKTVLLKLSPVQLPKAIKNDVELAGMKEAHIKDAIAKCAFLSWLEEFVRLSKTDDDLKIHTEFTLAEKLDSQRMKMKNSRGLSFSTISSLGPNGAVIHYKPCKYTSRALSRELYVVDSGGQYLEGTTDVTRTLHLGSPTESQIKCNTLVLKGHLQLRRQCFPKGTRGTQLDVLARQFLWQSRLDYLHGTGHGVGSYLNVHEGPQRISKFRGSNMTDDEVELEPGMVLSNEPGYYKDGEFGVRIENLMFVKKIPHLNERLPTTEFYGFEDLTLIPYQRKLIDVAMLTYEEFNEINDYHLKVKEILLPRIDACETELDNKAQLTSWLIEVTEPLMR